jgi:16S rRNA (uracil1498-N3)-methyltransferase
MSHPRIFYCPQAKVSANVELPPDEARHALRVLRLAVGDSLRLFDGRGFFYDGELTSAGRGAATVQVNTQVASTAEPHVRLILLAALLKGKKADFLIQKAVELGVGEIWFFEARRSVAQWHGMEEDDNESDAARRERWDKIVVSACKQCERAGLMPVRLLPSFQNVLEQSPETAHRFVYCGEHEAEDSGVQHAETASCTLRDSLEPILALIGPEGGLTPEEIASAMQAGFQPRSLGARILRAETAALAAATVLLYQAGELGK